jgi:NAD(P)-dependent dehydrogenase (short-subunit alcohol dehydrogenase family)
MAAEFLKKGWNVVGTVRGGGARTMLHDLADAFKGRLEIEILDICEQDQLAALHDRLSGRTFDMFGPEHVHAKLCGPSCRDIARWW